MSEVHTTCCRVVFLKEQPLYRYQEQLLHRKKEHHSEHLLHKNVWRFRGGLVFKAHRRLYHSTLGLKVIKKNKNV